MSQEEIMSKISAKFHEKSFRISPPVSDMNATGLVHALSIMVRGDASWRPSYLLT